MKKIILSLFLTLFSFVSMNVKASLEEGVQELQESKGSLCYTFNTLSTLLKGAPIDQQDALERLKNLTEKQRADLINTPPELRKWYNILCPHISDLYAQSENNQETYYNKVFTSPPPVIFSRDQIDLISRLSLKVLEVWPQEAPLITLGRSPLSIYHALKAYLPPEKGESVKHIHFSGSPDFVKLPDDIFLTDEQKVRAYFYALVQALIVPEQLENYHLYLATVLTDSLPDTIFILDTIRSGNSILAFLKILHSFYLTKKTSVSKVTLISTYPITDTMFNMRPYALPRLETLHHTDGTRTMTFDSGSVFGPCLPKISVRELIPFSEMYSVAPFWGFKILKDDTYAIHDSLSKTRYNLAGGLHFPPWRWGKQDSLFEQEIHPAGALQLISLQEAVNRMHGNKVPSLAYLALEGVKQDPDQSDRALKNILASQKIKAFFTQ